MAKLYFRYGAMGSSKTANALMVRYNYLEKGQPVLLLKPRTDNRDGAQILRSRIGLEAEGVFVDDFIGYIRKNWEKSGESPVYMHYDHPESIDWKTFDWHNYAAIIVDEAQFLTPEEVDTLSDIVDVFSIPVLCYGLRTDFQSNFFPGSRRLMEIADRIEEVPTVCWCGHRAEYNARICDGKIVRTGAQVMVGGNESYTSLCRKHFKLGMIGPEIKDFR